MKLGRAGLKEAAPVVGAALRDEISRDVGEMDASLWGSLASGAWNLAKAGAKEAAPVVGAALRDEISRDVGEMDASFWDMVKSAGS